LANFEWFSYLRIRFGNTRRISKIRNTPFSAKPFPAPGQSQEFYKSGPQESLAQRYQRKSEGVKPIVINPFLMKTVVARKSFRQEIPKGFGSNPNYKSPVLVFLSLQPVGI